MIGTLSSVSSLRSAGRIGGNPQVVFQKIALRGPLRSRPSWIAACAVITSCCANSTCCDDPAFKSNKRCARSRLRCRAWQRRGLCTIQLTDRRPVLRPRVPHFVGVIAGEYLALVDVITQPRINCYDRAQGAYPHSPDTVVRQRYAALHPQHSGLLRESDGLDLHHRRRLPVRRKNDFVRIWFGLLHCRNFSRSFWIAASTQEQNPRCQNQSFASH